MRESKRFGSSTEDTRTNTLLNTFHFLADSSVSYLFVVLPPLECLTRIPTFTLQKPRSFHVRLVEFFDRSIAIPFVLDCLVNFVTCEQDIEKAFRFV